MAFLVHRQHQRGRGRADVEADDVPQLGSGSLESLNVLTQGGTSPCAFQISCTALRLTPNAFAWSSA
jgi:hypothetical protein